MGKLGFLKSIHYKFAMIYVLLILIAMQIISVYFIDRLEKEFIGNFTKGIRDRVELLAYNVNETWQANQKQSDDIYEASVARLVKNFPSESIPIRKIQIINPNGEIIVDDGIVNNVSQRSNDVRVKRALFGTEASNTLRDATNGDRVYVLAMPITGNESDSVKGAVYVEASMESTYEQIQSINRILVSATAIALGITAFLGIFLARTITRPMADMRKQARVMARGDFSRKVHVYGDDEIGQLADSFNDLTKKLEEANAITEGERKKLSSVLAYMNDGVLATDSRGMVILMNERAEQMLNLSRQIVIGTPLLEVLHLSEDVSWDELYSGPGSILLDFSTDEQTFILRANFSFIKNEDGVINGMITVLHDVTEQEQIEQERRQFVVNVSHELRTPLTTLKSYLETLEDGAWRDETIAPKFLQVTQKETERMIRLVNDLLALSKMDKKDTFNMECIEFIPYFHRIIDRFEVSRPENIIFIRQIQRLSVSVSFDKDKMTQVIDNIISNAIKYSPEGGTVTFRCWVQSQKLRVSISDEGVGIPKAQINKVFDRFYRVDRARSRQLGGTGLGLAIAREIIHTHGGDIWAESEWGKGTTIYFTLPFQQVKEVKEGT